MCAPGRTDFLCQNAAEQQCFVHIREPNFDQGCMGNPDSDYYLYSLGGFAPCFYFDFSATYEITVTIECQLVTLAAPAPNEISPGYQYRDVVTAPIVNATHFALAAPFVPSLTLEFNIRDMKYLSNANSTVIITTDAAVMYGTANLTFPINF